MSVHADSQTRWDTHTKTVPRGRWPHRPHTPIKTLILRDILTTDAASKSTYRTCCRMSFSLPSSEWPGSKELRRFPFAESLRSFSHVRKGGLSQQQVWWAGGQGEATHAKETWLLTFTLGTRPLILNFAETQRRFALSISITVKHDLYLILFFFFFFWPRQPGIQLMAEVQSELQQWQCQILNTLSHRGILILNFNLPFYFSFLGGCTCSIWRFPG